MLLLLLQVCILCNSHLTLLNSILMNYELLHCNLLLLLHLLCLLILDCHLLGHFNEQIHVLVVDFFRYKKVVINNLQEVQLIVNKHILWDTHSLGKLSVVEESLSFSVHVCHFLVIFNSKDNTGAE